MARISLTPDQADLLRAVQAGKVARHRMRRHESPSLGQDFQDVPGHGPGGLRRAGRGLNSLKTLGLVTLPAGDDHVETWPWKTTDLGDHVIEALRTAYPIVEQRACTRSESQEA